jgi:hypothetical protein
MIDVSAVNHDKVPLAVDVAVYDSSKDPPRIVHLGNVEAANSSDRVSLYLSKKAGIEVLASVPGSAVVFRERMNATAGSKNLVVPVFAQRGHVLSDADATSKITSTFGWLASAGRTCPVPLDAIRARLGALIITTGGLNAAPLLVLSPDEFRSPKPDREDLHANGGVRTDAVDMSGPALWSLTETSNTYSRLFGDIQRGIPHRIAWRIEEYQPIILRDELADDITTRFATLTQARRDVIRQILHDRGDARLVYINEVRALKQIAISTTPGFKRASESEAMAGDVITPEGVYTFENAPADAHQLKDVVVAYRGVVLKLQGVHGQPALWKGPRDVEPIFALKTGETTELAVGQIGESPNWSCQ